MIFKLYQRLTDYLSKKTVRNIYKIKYLYNNLKHLKYSNLNLSIFSLVITAVSPNVVVTVMLKLKEDRLGLNSGIHTLIYAMTTCNDVLAIFLFGVFCGVIFSTGEFKDILKN